MRWRRFLLSAVLLILASSGTFTCRSGDDDHHHDYDHDHHDLNRQRTHSSA